MMCKPVLFTLFDCPIGWDELGVIVSILGVIATVGAVIVALVANAKASEQLASALAIQEQSKNVELLNKRMELVGQIDNGENVSVSYIKVLFGDSYVQKYNEMAGYQRDAKNAQSDSFTYFRLFQEENNRVVVDTDVEKEIHRYEMMLDSEDPPDDVESEFEAFCNSHVYWENNTPYNYYKIRIIEAESISRYNAAKEKLVGELYTFVRNSIAPIESKKSRRGRHG